MRKHSKRFLNALRAVTGKRSRIVVEHILEHGHITTEELERDYGYKHPPRAVRDVREQGIPIETFNVTSSEGKSIAAYRFGDPSELREDLLHGRRVLPKSLKEHLIDECGARCAICSCELEERYFQIDHKVPYAIAGDPDLSDLDPAEFMLLCGSCNRAKSWSCEHCPNVTEAQEVGICQRCYWASPEEFDHVALEPIRRLDLVWTGKDVALFERLRAKAQAAGEAMPGYVRAVVDKHARSRSK